MYSMPSQPQIQKLLEKDTPNQLKYRLGNVPNETREKWEKWSTLERRAALAAYLASHLDKLCLRDLRALIIERTAADTAAEVNALRCHLQLTTSTLFFSRSLRSRD